MTADQGHPGEPAGHPRAEELLARLARLEGRIAGLEKALERRSQEVLLLQSVLSPTDLLQLARIADGLSPLPRIAHQPEYWTETTAITKADLEATLEDLWTSLTPGSARPSVARRGAMSRPVEAATGAGE